MSQKCGKAGNRYKLHLVYFTGCILELEVPTLFAIALPLSYIIAGVTLELLNKKYCFVFSSILLIVIVAFKKQIESNSKRNPFTVEAE
jgi:membrane protein implicated in regulation of membrane protease activity